MQALLQTSSGESHATSSSTLVRHRKEVSALQNKHTAESSFITLAATTLTITSTLPVPLDLG